MISDSKTGPWELVLREVLEDRREEGWETYHRPLTVQTFYFPPVSARFVRFDLLKAFGYRGCLQYFKAGYKEGKTEELLSRCDLVLFRGPRDSGGGGSPHQTTLDRSNGTFTCRAVVPETGEVQEKQNNLIVSLVLTLTTL